MARTMQQREILMMAWMKQKGLDSENALETGCR
ncbi:UNVERIFIED_CONTAM: hypothetical protein GTU68_054671 [Idotea baltica]|nr:hypothetical protein [Idotea baltica]